MFLIKLALLKISVKQRFGLRKKEQSSMCNIDPGTLMQTISNFREDQLSFGGAIFASQKPNKQYLCTIGEKSIFLI